MDHHTPHKPPALDGRLAVHFWPDTAPVWADGVCVIAVRTENGQQRVRPRQQIRHAVRAVLAELLDIAPAAIHLPDAEGAVPRIVFDDAGAAAARRIAPDDAIAYSISHETGLTVAAINLRGAIGIDVLQVRDIADWQPVARDYLGPDVARGLAAVAPPQRASALARAWTAREAALKCLGLALQEWTPAALPCQTAEIMLPQGYAGSFSIPTTGMRRSVQPIE